MMLGRRPEWTPRSFSGDLSTMRKCKNKPIKALKTKDYPFFSRDSEPTFSLDRTALTPTVRYSLSIT
jgi:hypothetical protein